MIKQLKYTIAGVNKIPVPLETWNLANSLNDVL